MDSPICNTFSQTGCGVGLGCDYFFQACFLAGAGRDGTDAGKGDVVEDVGRGLVQGQEVLDGRRTGKGHDVDGPARQEVRQGLAVFAGCDGTVGLADVDDGTPAAQGVRQDGPGFFGPRDEDAFFS